MWQKKPNAAKEAKCGKRSPMRQKKPKDGKPNGGKISQLMAKSAQGGHHKPEGDKSSMAAEQAQYRQRYAPSRITPIRGPMKRQ